MKRFDPDRVPIVGLQKSWLQALDRFLYHLSVFLHGVVGMALYDDTRCASYPAPWRLTGRGCILAMRFPVAYLREGTGLTESLRASLRSAISWVMFVDYESADCGPYRELLFIPGSCQFSQGRFLTISKIYVSTESSVVSNYRKYGPIYRIRVLWLKFTVILGFEAKQFLIDGRERHLNRHPVFDPVGEQLGSADFALALSGEKHMALRRILQIAYSREMASPHVPQFIQSVQQVVRGWKDGSVMEVFESIQFLAFEQYCRVMGRCEWIQHYRDFREVTDMNMEVGGRVKPLWMFKWPPYRATRRRVLKIIWDLVQKRRAKVGVNPGPADIVDTLMSQRFPDGRPMNDDEVVCYALYGFAGGCSYMGRLIAFMLYEIQRDPQLHGRLKS